MATTAPNPPSRPPFLPAERVKTVLTPGGTLYKLYKLQVSGLIVAVVTMIVPVVTSRFVSIPTITLFMRNCKATPSLVLKEGGCRITISIKSKFAEAIKSASSTFSSFCRLPYLYLADMGIRGF